MSAPIVGYSSTIYSRDIMLNFALELIKAHYFFPDVVRTTERTACASSTSGTNLYIQKLIVSYF